MASEPLAAVLQVPPRRFRPYPKYKDSGVEWLGDIPTHWEVKRLKRICTFAYGESLASPDRTDGDVEVLGSNGQVGTNDHANTLGPCLVIGRKGSFGKINYSPKPVFAIDTTFYIDSRFTEEDLRWLYYALTDARLDASSKDSAIPGLDREDAYTRDLLWCSREEQFAIATFLDRETAKIDALVGKKERVIELLQEKRAALITQAVARGLDPSVSMKDSGVEWLGVVPAHWDVAPVYSRYVVELGKMLDAKRVTGEHLAPYIRNVDVQWDRVNVQSLPEMDFEPIERPRYSLRAGDLVVCEGGEVGRTAIWRGELDECFYQEAIHRVRPVSTRDEPRFFFYMMHSAAKRGVFVAGGNPNTIDHLTAIQLQHYRFAFPPRKEQEEVSGLLDTESARIDDLVRKIEDGIARLKEFRTALISAAVTGKIDVREESA